MCYGKYKYKSKKNTFNKISCYYCNSTKLELLTTMLHLMDYPIFVDENGAFHEHDTNLNRTFFRCKKCHTEFYHIIPNTCDICDWVQPLPQ